MYDCPGEESSVDEDPPRSGHPAQPELLLGWPPETGGFLILIRAGLCCKKKRLPLLLWCLWSVIQQEPKLLYHTGNCICCVFSSTCLNLISLDFRQLLFSPFHLHFTHTLQYLGNGTSVFDKPRNVPLCIASAEQGLSGEGLPFCPNMFPELLSKSGESCGWSRIGAPLCISGFTCKPWQFAVAFLSAGPGGMPGLGAVTALSIINLMLLLIISKKCKAKGELHKSVNQWA